MELAAELSRTVEFASGYGPGDIRRRLRVTLLESSPRILGAFPETISRCATMPCRARRLVVSGNVLTGRQRKFASGRASLDVISRLR
jgi:hypothetical protein